MGRWLLSLCALKQYDQLSPLDLKQYLSITYQKHVRRGLKKRKSFLNYLVPATLCLTPPLSSPTSYDLCMEEERCPQMWEDDRPQRTHASHTIVLAVWAEGRVLVSCLGNDILGVFHCLCQFTPSPLQASVLSTKYVLDKEAGQATIACEQLLLSFPQNNVPETTEGQPGCGTSASHTPATHQVVPLRRKLWLLGPGYSEQSARADHRQPRNPCPSRPHRATQIGVSQCVPQCSVLFSLPNSFCSLRQKIKSFKGHWKEDLLLLNQ